MINGNIICPHVIVLLESMTIINQAEPLQMNYAGDLFIIVKPCVGSATFSG